MCNCNKKTQSYSSEMRGGMNKRKVRYTGDDTLSLNGNITGRLYRFTQRKSVVLVDARDAEDFRGVEGLQIIS